MRILGVFTAIVLLFLWLPLLFVFQKGVSVEAFRLLWEKSEIREAFLNSLGLALVTSVISTALGTCTAFSLPRLSPRATQFVQTTMLVPMVLPEIAFGLAYLVWFVKIGLVLGWSTLLLGHVAFTYCYSVIVMKVGVEQMNWSLLDAARDLGASRLHIFRHAVLPQIMPSLMASGMMVFSLSLDDFFISIFIKGVEQMTLPIKIYSMIRVKIGPEIYALSVILFCISVVTVLISQLWLQKSQKNSA